MKGTLIFPIIFALVCYCCCEHDDSHEKNEQSSNAAVHKRSKRLFPLLLPLIGVGLGVAGATMGGLGLRGGAERKRLVERQFRDLENQLQEAISAKQELLDRHLMQKRQIQSDVAVLQQQLTGIQQNIEGIAAMERDALAQRRAQQKQIQSEFANLQRQLLELDRNVGVLRSEIVEEFKAMQMLLLAEKAELKGQMQSGFNNLQTQLLTVDRNVGNIGRGLNDSIFAMGKNIVAHQNAMQKQIDSDFNALQQQLVTVDQNVANVGRGLNESISTLGNNIFAKQNDLQRQMESDFNTLQLQLGTVDRNIGDLNKSINERLAIMKKLVTAQHGELREQMQSDVAYLQKQLITIGRNIGDLEKRIDDTISALGKRIEFRITMGPFVQPLTWAKFLVEEFAKLNKTDKRFQSKMDGWTGSMMTQGLGSAKYTLYLWHQLIMGSDTAVTQPIFKLFYEVFTANDEYQSRLWKTQVYADMMLGRQAVLYGLWITALRFKNETHVDEAVLEVEDICKQRFAEQIAILSHVQLNATPFFVPAKSENYGESVCSASPLCLSTGFGFRKEGQQVKVVSQCVRNYTDYESWNVFCPTALQTGTQRTFISTQMLTVSDSEKESICGVAVWEDRVESHRYIRIKAKICKKVTGGRLQFAHSSVMQSSIRDMLKLPDNVRINFVPTKLPLLYGWVVSVGLNVGGVYVDQQGTSRVNVTIQIQTDYFPSLKLMA